MHSRKSRLTAVAVAVAFVQCFNSSDAAEITVASAADFPWGGWSQYDDAHQCNFILQGDINPGDIEKFKRLHGSPRSKGCMFPRIMLNSPGGNFLEGVAFAEYFITHGISTGVASGSECGSACALAFMGGTQFDQDGGSFSSRHLHVGGTLYFHAPYQPGGDVVVGNELASNAWRAGIAAVKKLIALGNEFARSRQNQIEVFPQALLNRLLEAGKDEKVALVTIKDAAQAKIQLYGLPDLAGISKRMISDACENISEINESECRTGNDLIEVTQSSDAILASAYLSLADAASWWGQCKFSIRALTFARYQVVTRGNVDHTGILEPLNYFPPEARLSDLPMGVDRNPTIRADREGNLSLVATSPGLPTLWNHNGSIMRLVADRDSRRFVYEQPRPGIAELGVARGAPAFEGARDGNRYSGIAYVFSKRCGRAAYNVIGTVSPDEKTVRLRGRAPVRGANCKVSGYREDSLEFRLIEKGPY